VNNHDTTWLGNPELMPWRADPTGPAWTFPTKPTLTLDQDSPPTEPGAAPEVDATATPPTITLEQQVSGHEHTTPERSRPGPSSAGRPVTNAAPFAVNDVLIHRRARPTGGWRAALYTATGGRCNPGLSLAQAEHRLLLDRVRTPLRGAHQIVVTSLKGGIGKTTITAGLGLTLAEHRGDRIIALDANPDAGTLADRLTGHVGVTIRDLLDNLDTITSWTDIAHYTSIAGRLQVLASDQDPALSEAFNRDQYTAVTDLLRRYFSVLITDSGTGLVHSAMAGALQAADTLVIAAAPTLDGASRAAKTLDWLVAHDHAHLVEHAVVALSHDRSSRWVDPRPIREHFTRRCHAVIDIPQDPHLTVGGPIRLDELRTRTRDAFLQLAAHIAEQFTSTPTRSPLPDHAPIRQEPK